MNIKNQKVRLIEKDMPFKDKLKYVTKFISNAFFIAILLCISGISILAMIYMGDRVINLNNNTKPIFGAYVIATPSMVPTLMVNDGIIVKRQKDFIVGDIITFDSEDPAFAGLNITHRVINKEQLSNGKYAYKTKGDNNDAADPATVGIDNIYGKTILKVPQVGCVKSLLTNPFVLTLMLVVPLFIIVVTNFGLGRKDVEVLN
ncbi:MAG: signal peptidase I [Bacilli bacterium]|nr:signal peptidase I [Bacilli bacterium]MBQ6539020.1 signal peptidase I [Bacilli bacterium]